VIRAITDERAEMLGWQDALGAIEPGNSPISLPLREILSPTSPNWSAFAS